MVDVERDGAKRVTEALAGTGRNARLASEHLDDLLELARLVRRARDARAAARRAPGARADSR